MPPPNSKAPQRSPALSPVAFAGLAISLSAVAAVRTQMFADLEPRMDHAFFMQWVQSMREAKRFLPDYAGLGSFTAALASDPQSWLHALLRPIFAVSKLLLTVVSLFWFYLGSFVVGAGSEGQITLSILAQAAAIGVLSLICFSASGGGILLAAMAAILASASSFLHVFSPLGSHNVALLALITALWAFDRLLRAAATPKGPSWNLMAVAFGIQAIALCSYFSVIFLLPLGVFLALTSDSRIHPRRRFRLILLHVAATAMALLPLAGVILWDIWRRGSEVRGQSFLYFLTQAWHPSGAGGAFAPMAMLEWFERLAETFSWPGLALGVLGLFWLARRGNCPLPLALALAHFAVWSAVPQFRQYDRTIVYMTPFLALGAASAALAAWRTRRVLVRTAAFLLLAAHLAIDLPRLADPTRVASWANYYRTQGTFRAFMTQVRTIVPSDAVLMFEDYGPTHIWRALASGTPGHRIATPLGTILARPSDPAGLPFPPTGVTRDKSLFILASTGRVIDASMVSRIPFDDHARPCGRSDVNRVLELPAPGFPTPTATLYRIDWAAPN